MTFYLKGQFISKGSRTSDKNGKTYYSLAVLQGTESVQLGCSPQVFEQLDGYNQLDEIIVRFSENVMSGRSGAFISRYVVALGDG